MHLNAPWEIANELKGGRYPDAQPWNLSAAAQAIADELIPRGNQVPVDEIRKAVKVLNDNRHFDLTHKVADAWLASRGFDPTIQKRLVQSLINTGRIDVAEGLARNGLEICRSLPDDKQAASEIPEYQGLLGRIFKQRFVLTDDRNWLSQASDQYLTEYDKDRRNNFWHGINAVALLARDGSSEVRGLATEIRRTVTKAYEKKPSSWLAATASEACLALGKCDEAELWLYRFLNLSDTKPFDIDSYSRQLREIWQGDPFAGGSCAGRLAGIIARHLARFQSRVVLDPAQVPAMISAIETNAAGLEKNFLGESSFGVQSIRDLLEACASIGCVSNSLGERLGTGFLVRGSWFKDGFGDSPVFVTNAHVISDSVSNAILRNDARVTFELDVEVNGARRAYNVKDVLFTSDPGRIGVTNGDCAELDCTIVTLDGLPADTPVLHATDKLPNVKPLTKAFVAGHPRGAGLQISLHDSMLLDIDEFERLLHYRTPTDPGSSGSPVFNARWQVMALHHAGTSETPRLHGTGSYEANEGIALAAVRRKVNA